MKRNKSATFISTTDGEDPTSRINDTLTPPTVHGFHARSNSTGSSKTADSDSIDPLLLFHLIPTSKPNKTDDVLEILKSISNKAHQFEPGTTSSYYNNDASTFESDAIWSSSLLDLDKEALRAILIPDERLLRAWCLIFINEHAQEQDRVVLLTTSAYYRVCYIQKEKKIKR
jgi:hypothetical protein